MPVSNSRLATPESPGARKASAPAAQSGSLSLRPLNDPLTLSDTDTLDNSSSPELSALALPPRLPPRTPKSAAAPSDSTFYTASWGSPYDIGSLPAGSQAGPSNRNPAPSVTGDDLEDSPGVQFGLSHLIPSRLPPTSHFEVSPTRPSTPNPQNPVQLTPRPSFFDSNTIAQVVSPARNLFTSLVKTLGGSSQTADDAVEQKKVAEPKKVIEQKKVTDRKRHPTRQDNRTLRQEDFIGTLPSRVTMETSKYASPSTKTENKPAESTPQQSPIAPKPQSLPFSPTSPTTPSLDIPPALSRGTLSNTSPSRLKKKLVYKSKTCWVCLPRDTLRGKEGQPPIPLSEAEVTERLQYFEKLGYDTRGFGHWNNHDKGINVVTYAQNCAIHPDPLEQWEEGRQQSFRVRIPNKQDWDDYVNFLTEQKLKALGVGLGEPEDVPLSRQPSSQFSGNPLSPPLRTSSAGSHRIMASVSGFPTGFVPGSSNHTSTRSIASPLSALGNPRSLHMHRQSMFVSPPPVLQQSISPLGFQAWSPQPFLNASAPHSTGSPVISSGVSDLRSPISPFGVIIEGAQPYAYAPRDDLVAQMQKQQQHQMQIQQQLHQQQQQQQRQQQQQQQLQLQQPPPIQPQPYPVIQPQVLPVRSATTLAEVPEAETEDETHPSPPRSAPPEIANPRPRHRHNISAQLEENVKENYPGQKEVEVAEAVLEKSEVSSPQEQNTVPEWRRNAPIATKDADLKEEKPLPLKPETEVDMTKAVQNLLPLKPLEDAEKEQEVGRTYTSEYNVEPAMSELEPSDVGSDLENDANLATSLSSNPWANDPTFHRESSPEKPPSHHSANVSLSVLNAQAKEFNPIGNPSASFNPAIFSPASFTLNPSTVRPFVPRSISGSTQPQKASTFNVAAPEFNPSSGFGSTNFSKSEFSFSTSMPVLKPTAPSFQPGSNGIFSFESSGRFSSDNSPRVFAQASVDEFSKPRPTKAIPIVPPREKDELQEDERGPSGPANAKRTKHEGDGGDSVPQFALPDLASSLGDFSKATLVGEDLEEPEELQGPTAAQSIAQLRPVQAEVPAEPESDETKEHDEPADESELPSSPPTLDTTSRIVSGTSTLSALATPFEFGRKPGIVSPLTPERMDSIPTKPLPALDAMLSPPSSSSPAFHPHQEVEHRSTGSADRKLPSSVRYYDDIEGPTYQEIDAVMQHFNEEGSDAGVERDTHSWPDSSALEDVPKHLVAQPALSIPLRSDAPSPSPRRTYLMPNPPMEADSASITQDPFSDGRAAERDESPMHRLSEYRDTPNSDWGPFSSADEERIRSHGGFFNTSLTGVINGALDQRLNPLESQLKAIQDSIVGLAHRSSLSRLRSRATVDSDADDEDDVDTDFNSRAFSRSPMRDRRLEKFKIIVQDALANHQLSSSPTMRGLDLSSVHEALAEMKSAIGQPSQINSQDLRTAVEAALTQQSFDKHIEHLQKRMDDVKATIESTISKREEALASRDPDESSILSELLQKNADAIARAAEESEARKFAERRELDTQKLLKLAEEEIVLLKAAAKGDSDNLRALHEEQKVTLSKLADAETAKVELANRVAVLSENVEAQRATLEEHRLSHTKLRDDLERVSREKEKLSQGLAAVTFQAEESVRIRDTMRERLEKLQQDAANAVGKLADERSRWQRSDAEHRTRYEVLRTQVQAEARTRERFEKEMERLEVQEREAMKLRAVLEHMQQENSRLRNEVNQLVAKERDAARVAINLEHFQKENVRLEELVGRLRKESADHEKAAARFARDHHEAREAGRVEVQRTTILMQAEIDTANNQVNMLRAELESEISRLRSDLDSAKMDLDAARAKQELIVEQESDARRDAIKEITESKAAVLLEQKHAFEERLEDLRKQHRRDLDHIIENKNQAETFLRETHSQRLADMEEQHQRTLDQMTDAKHRSELHLNERLTLSHAKASMLEEKVSVLEHRLSLTQTAAQAAAQAAQSAKSIGVPSVVTTPAVVRNEGGISAQALRESIAVLQDQLQERETRIENLEQQLSTVDKSLPEKLRARDTEVTWLRELLGVRIDDLSELVNLLSRDDFDRASVRNAAIRIRAGLQMELHDKEHAQKGVNLTGSAANIAASISSFASPRAAQLAKVIGDWRSAQAGPSKQSPSLLSGLRLASPSPSARAPIQLAVNQPGRSRPLAGISPIIKSKESDESPPRTPLPLLAREAYDQDAETGRYSTDGHDEENSTVEGSPQRHRYIDIEDDEDEE